ncbi:ligand-gated ion channel isoform B [Chlorella sorokiniana]|uniref:Ligand-gated ion channel isoform B n=1 Tax=Chlorella sorokiniana TaxID=3076 RepID=A0A2P6U377_CHLSO|nr:ligand-gated ion channel isoform B [Chlorella sorokiniana]|eukprot:PRW60768.1 ligand-gated ion channel isoform B [Chlorella sorokiniana]
MAAAPHHEDTPHGQWQHGPNTTDVYLSVYLDRLLNVDDVNYHWTGVLYFYITWTDPAAYQTVRAATGGWLAGNRSCAHECSDWVRESACCDGIFQPTLFGRNVHSYPQDRATGYKIYALPEPNNSVLWTQTVQATYYQMDLSHYPFDSWELIAIYEFLDTAVPPHPGVKVHISSGGPRLYTFGRGDAVSEWEVQSPSANLVYVDSEAFFKSHWTLPSDPSDPLGLTTTSSARLRGCPPGATSVQPLPKHSAHWGGWLASRHESVVVTLFLAMAPVQFVITEHQPASSYLMPTQQLVIATYVLPALIATESILVYYVVTWKRCTQLSRERTASPHEKAAADAVADVDREAAAAAAAEAVAQAAVATAAAQGTSGRGCGAPSRRALTRLQSLSLDEQLDEYYGQLIDRASLLVLAVGYILSCILIFTLQRGYIDLFGSG